MVRISLTDFVDFAISSGTPKLTKVKTVKNRGAYQPAFDFWKPLREGIVGWHKGGATDKKQLNKILTKVSDAKKLARYAENIKGYKKFIGLKKIAWFSPPKAEWGPQGIKIRVNPELGFKFSGRRYFVKLYFKKESLSKRRVEIILLLMSSALGKKAGKGVEFGLLDVPRGKLFSTSSPNSSLLPLLDGEAVAFLTIWNRI